MAFFSIQAEELFSQPDVQVTQALDVLRELADASSDLVATNVSQLPRDLETASNIVAKTVDLLLVSAAGNDTVNGTLLKEVYVNEVSAQNCRASELSRQS